MGYSDLYGKADIKSMDFIAYIIDMDEVPTYRDGLKDSFEDEFHSYADFEREVINPNSGKYSFQKIGKLDRAVSYSTETGETIVDNKGVENIVDRTATVSFEHIASNNEVKGLMRSIDGHNLAILLVSKKGKQYHCVLIPEARYHYEESSTSGGVDRLPFTASRDVTSIADFRLITTFTDS